MSEALNHKQKGNDKLKNGDAKGAVSEYKDGIDFL